MAYKKGKVRIQEVIDQLGKVESTESSEKQNENRVVSLTALKKWRSIPEILRKQLERNLFCVSCLDAVQIQNYTVKEDKGVISLHGQCKDCGNEVVRVID
jgi:hypothetical protein